MENLSQSPRKPDSPLEKASPQGGTAWLFKMHLYLTAFFKDVINLRKGVDPGQTIEEIRKKDNISGANAWMLMCSIMIASIGLSQNSQAVIIGGMLISPLMSPILGVGLSVGVNDMYTLRRALSHFGAAILIAILTSTIYFYLQPIDVITPEIEARTKPTFLDIFVAIFGGVAGIISIARKDISTTIPGVAIATALMPPLCVTGYGLSQGDMEIASKSFYLFFLNSFFVALATYLIVRYLKFPYKQFVERNVRRKNIVYVFVFSVAVVVPSFFIFRKVLHDLRKTVTLQEFEVACLGDKSIFMDSYHLDETQGILYLRVYGDTISVDDAGTYEECLADLGLPELSIVIIPTSDVRMDQVKVIEDDIAKISSQLAQVNKEKQTQESKIIFLNNSNIDTSSFQEIKKEMHILFPAMDEIALAKMHSSDFDTTNYFIPILLLNWGRDKPRERNINDRVGAFVSERLELDTLRVIEF